MIDEQINIALETRDNLVNQREILKVNKDGITYMSVNYNDDVAGSADQVE